MPKLPKKSVDEKSLKDTVLKEAKEVATSKLGEFAQSQAEDAEIISEEKSELEARTEAEHEEVKRNRAQASEARAKEQLDEKQLHDLDGARKAAQDANPFPGLVQPGTTSPLSSDAAAEAAEKKAQEQEEIQQRNEEIQSDVESKIEEVKQKLDEKISKIADGPHGLLAFWASPATFFMALIIDSIGSIAIIGDALMAFALGIFWTIPALLLFDFVLLLKIYAFLFIDWAVGTFGGTIANVIPFLGDGLVDAIPELVALTGGVATFQLIKRSYEMKKPSLIAKAKHFAELRIQQIRADGKERMRFALKKLKGHFTGVAVEGKEVISLFLVGLIGFLGPFHLNVLTLEGGPSSFYVLAFFLVFIGVLKAIDVIGSRHMVGLYSLTGLSFAIDFLLKNNDLLSFIPNDGGIVVTAFGILLAILIALRTFKPEQMPTQRMIGIMALLLLLAFSGYIVGHISSDAFIESAEQRRVERAAELDNLNPIERLTQWYLNMQARGRGEYIPTANQENVHEYIGIKVESIETSRDVFTEGKPVQVDVFYSTGSKESIFVRTTCETQGLQGEIVPAAAVPATELYTPTVKCRFDGLPSGTHIIEVNSFYEYESAIEIPLMFMTEQKFEQLLDGDEDPEKFQGGVNNPETSSGPIDFGVSTSAKDGQPIFKMPLVLDPNPLTINEFPHSVTVQLHNPLGDSRTQGELESINSVSFDLPAGLQLGDCNFQGINEPLLRGVPNGNGRWVVDVTPQFQELTEVYKTLSCSLYIDTASIPSFAPTTGFSIHTMYYTINYNYKLSENVPVTVS